MTEKLQGAPAQGVPPVSFFERFLFLILAAGVLLFIVWPVMAVLRESFFPGGQFSLVHYRALFSNNGRLLKNSLVVAGLTTCFSLVMGLCIALYLTHSGLPGKKTVLGVLLLSFVSPPFVSSLAYIMLFGRRGLITWKLLGIRWNPYGLHGVVLMEGIAFATIAAFLILAVLRGIDRSLEQASLDLGAGPTATLLHITFPLAMPGIVTAALIVFIRSLSDFGTPMIIGGNYNVLATQAYMVALGSYDMPAAAAICTVLLIPALAVFFVYRRLMGRPARFAGRRAPSAVQGLVLPAWASVVVAVVTWSFVAMEVLKYGTIFWGAFARTWGVNFSLTLDHVRALRFSKMGSFVRSLEYGFIAALAASVMGMLLAWLLGRRRGPAARFLDFVVDLPFILPGPFFGIGYLLAFNWLPAVLFGSGLLVVANCTYRQLTVGTKSGLSVLSQINPELEDAVRDQGGGQFHVLRDVVLPLMKPAFLVSFINAFTASMTTIGAIIFLVTPYTKVATVEMFEAIQNGEIGLGAVMASLIIVAVMVVNLGFSWLFLRKKNVNSGKEADYVPSVEAVAQKV